MSVGGVLEAARNLASPLRRIGRSSHLAGPILVVALGLTGLIVPRLVAYHGNPSGFVQFGHYFAPQTHPPDGAIVGSPIGYDGQFYWIQARDPLVLHPSTLADIDAAGRGYNLQRVAYPALAALLAIGQVSGGSRVMARRCSARC